MSASRDELLAKALPLKGLTDAVNVTDGAGARPHLGAVTAAAMLVGVALPFTALGVKFGMVPLPPVYFAWVALTLFTYCVLTQLVKLIYIRRYGRWL